MTPENASPHAKIMQALQIILAEYAKINVPIISYLKPLLIRQLLAAFKYVLKDIMLRVSPINAYKIAWQASQIITLNRVCQSARMTQKPMETSMTLSAFILA